MSIRVQLQQFEGPLDLLLYLIRKEEMDIFNINVVEITKQYLDYIKLMKEFDLEVAGEFVAMASTLIHIKSKMLLPQYDENGEVVESEDPRKELVQKLLEYEKFKEAAEAYEILSDADKKAQYDRYGHAGVSGNGRGGFSGGQGMNMDDIFSQFGDIFGEDIFGNFFGGGGQRGGGRGGQRRPLPRERPRRRAAPHGLPRRRREREKALRGRPRHKDARTRGHADVRLRRRRAHLPACRRRARGC